jgi:hypothetical protein
VKSQDATVLHEGPQVTDNACWIRQVDQNEASDDKVDRLRLFGINIGVSFQGQTPAFCEDGT